MGIFDKLKQVGNYLTGGGAKIHLELDTTLLSNEGKVTALIFCLVKESEIYVDKLYLNIRAEEKVKYRDNYGTASHSSNTHHGSTTRTQSVKTHSEKIVIDENFRLEANGEYEWQTEFFIPSGIPGTYRGINASHEWMAQAGLSKKGNDPNSEWISFEV